MPRTVQKPFAHRVKSRVKAASVVVPHNDPAALHLFALVALRSGRVPIMSPALSAGLQSRQLILVCEVSEPVSRFATA